MSSPIHHCSVYTEASRFLIICRYSRASLIGHWNVRLCLRSSLLRLIYLLLHTEVSSISAIRRLPLLIPTHSSSVSTLIPPVSLPLVTRRCSALHFATRFSVSRSHFTGLVLIAH